jgi:predicted nucleic acid-binding protein
MEIIILDTDILIDYFRGVEVAKDYILGIPANERATTDITLMELFKGASKKHWLMATDAFHVATMKKHGITNIATSDPGFERVEWIKVCKP